MHSSYLRQIMVAVALFSFAHFAAAIPLPVITIDELGNGTLDTGAGASSLPADLSSDPTVPGGPRVLTYFSPLFLTPGDVTIVEQALNSIPDSDLVRFLNAPNGKGSLILFYSDVTANDTANAPADVGIPANLQTNVVNMNETGFPAGAPYSEDNNGLFYTATGGMPAPASPACQSTTPSSATPTSQSRHRWRYPPLLSLF